VKIIHRVSLTDEPGQKDAVRSLGISFNEPDSPLIGNVWFDVDESHPGWRELQALIGEWKVSDIAHTEFDSSERATAKYLQMSPAWHHGFPQPDSDFGYLNATYDLKSYCTTCGIGKTQTGQFRMKGEPKWGKKHILQLNWLFDEYFVLPSVWEEVFRPFGIGRSSVLDHRTGHELRTIVQLDIKVTANSPLSIADNHPSKTCESCGRKKYIPISRGFFPAFAMDQSSPICRSQEFFGSGTSAWNAIIVSNEVYTDIQGRKLAGVTFVPLHAL
jgi:hypothetical protein